MSNKHLWQQTPSTCLKIVDCAHLLDLSNICQYLVIRWINRNKENFQLLVNSNALTLFLNFAAEFYILNINLWKPTFSAAGYVAKSNVSLTAKCHQRNSSSFAKILFSLPQTFNVNWTLLTTIHSRHFIDKNYWTLFQVHEPIFALFDQKDVLWCITFRWKIKVWSLLPWPSTNRTFERKIPILPQRKPWIRSVCFFDCVISILHGFLNF